MSEHLPGCFKTETVFFVFAVDIGLSLVYNIFRVDINRQNERLYWTNRLSVKYIRHTYSEETERCAVLCKLIHSNVIKCFCLRESEECGIE